MADQAGPNDARSARPFIRPYGIDASQFPVRATTLRGNMVGMTVGTHFIPNSLTVRNPASQEHYS
jgi:hypothetical protein